MAISVLIGVEDEPVVEVAFPCGVNIGEIVTAHGEEYEIYALDKIKNHYQIQHVYVTKRRDA